MPRPSYTAHPRTARGIHGWSRADSTHRWWARRRRGRERPREPPSRRTGASSPHRRCRGSRSPARRSACRRTCLRVVVWMVGRRGDGWGGGGGGGGGGGMGTLPGTGDVRLVWLGQFLYAAVLCDFWPRLRTTCSHANYGATYLRIVMKGTCAPNFRKGQVLTQPEPL